MDASAVAWPPLAAEPAPLRHWREEARSLVARTGLPTQADEHWRRTNLGFLAGLAHRGMTAGLGERDACPDEEPVLAAATRLCFIDGRFDALRSTMVHDDALDVTPSRAALRDATTPWQGLPHAALTGDLRFALLGRALGADGVQVVVRRGRSPRQPILLEHRGTTAHECPSAVAHAIRLEAGASATLVELYDERCGASRTLLSEVHVALGAGSRLLHLRLVPPSHASHLVDTLVVQAAQDAHYEQRAVLAPAGALRSTQALTLGGRGAQALLLAAAAAGRGADVDLRLLANHQADATRSEQTVHVLGGAGRATVDSEVQVPRGVRTVRSRQALRAVQVDATCDVALRPRLAILSDDVDCRHGATTAAVSPEQLFFLRSRGLAPDEARRLLAAAHLRQLFTPAGDEALHGLLQQHVQAALAAVVASGSEDLR